MTWNQCRIDTGDDNRVSKEEFCADNIKAAVEKWVGTIEDMEAEFGKIDANGGGQVWVLIHLGSLACFVTFRVGGADWWALGVEQSSANHLTFFAFSDVHF